MTIPILMVSPLSSWVSQNRTINASFSIKRPTESGANLLAITSIKVTVDFYNKENIKTKSIPQILIPDILNKGFGDYKYQFETDSINVKYIVIVEVKGETPYIKWVGGATRTFLLNAPPEIKGFSLPHIITPGDSISFHKGKKISIRFKISENIGIKWTILIRNLNDSSEAFNKEGEVSEPPYINEVKEDFYVNKSGNYTIAITCKGTNNLSTTVSKSFRVEIPPLIAKPILLLPLRIETKFEKDSLSIEKDTLSIRVFPDQCFLTSHRKVLSAKELADGRFYLNEKDPLKKSIFFKEMSQRHGAWRAAYIANTVKNLKPNQLYLTEEPGGSWLQYLIANSLNGRFFVYIIGKDNKKIFSGNFINNIDYNVNIFPENPSGSNISEKFSLLSGSFSEAVNAGWAATVQLKDVKEIKQIIVVCKDGRDVGKSVLEEMLVAHPSNGV